MRRLNNPNYQDKTIHIRIGPLITVCGKILIGLVAVAAGDPLATCKECIAKQQTLEAKK